MQKTSNIIMNTKNYVMDDMKENLIEILKKSEEEIEKGEGIEADIAFKELRQKYGY